MSKGFEKFVMDVQGNFSVVADFTQSPIEVMRKYGLTEEEIDAVMNKDVNILAMLTGSESMVSGILSGAHTPTCPTGSIN